MLQVLKTTKKVPKQLAEVPPPPLDMMYLVGWYRELQDGGPLDYQKLYYWQKVMSRSPASWEIETLLAMDNLYWNIKTEAGSK